MLEVIESDLPLVRPLDARPVSQYGRQYLVLRDPLQLADQPIVLPQPFVSALGFCDGQHTIDEICAIFVERSGVPLHRSDLCEMLSALDNAYMLNNRRYTAALQEAIRVYRNAPYRHPSMAGRAYPAGKAALQQLLDDYLTQVNQHSSPVNGADQDHSSSNRYRGLLSPHIDYARGGPVYAQVWHEAQATAHVADLVVMFGTDHNGADPFTLTKQNYATPYGMLPTCDSMVDALAETIGPEAAFAGELRHRGEHSLELVAVWLHHMRQGRPCELVPILVGGLHAHIRNETNPSHDPLLCSIFDTLQSEIQQAVHAGKTVLVVASGDLAHVGPEFGGEPLDQKSRQVLRQADERLIVQMQQGNPDQFFEEIRRVKDGNNVCGVTPIYLTMKMLERLDGPIAGTRTGYESCPADDFDTSAVTIGGVVFQ